MKFLRKLLDKFNTHRRTASEKEVEKCREVSSDQVYSYLKSHPYEPLYVLNGATFLFRLEYIGNNKLNFINYSQCNEATLEPLESEFDIMEFQMYKMVLNTDRVLTFLGVSEMLDGLEVNGF